MPVFFNFSPVQTHCKNVHGEIVAASAIPNPPKKVKTKGQPALRKSDVSMVLAASTSSTVKVEAEAGSPGKRGWAASKVRAAEAMISTAGDSPGSIVGQLGAPAPSSPASMGAVPQRVLNDTMPSNACDTRPWVCMRPRDNSADEQAQIHVPGFIHDAPLSIAQSRLKAGRIEYLVKWSGCPTSCDSWETAEKLSVPMVANFHSGASDAVQQHLMLEMQSPAEYIHDGGLDDPLAEQIETPMTAIMIEREQQDRDMLFNHWNKLSMEHRESPEMMNAIRNTIAYLGLSSEGTAFASEGSRASLDGADDDANQPTAVRTPTTTVRVKPIRTTVEQPMTPAIWSPLPARRGNGKKNRRNKTKTGLRKEFSTEMLESVESSSRAMAEIAESSSREMAERATKYGLQHSEFASMLRTQWTPSPSVQGQACQPRGPLRDLYLGNFSPTVDSPLGYPRDSPGVLASLQSPSCFVVTPPSIAQTEDGFVCHNNEWARQK